MAISRLLPSGGNNDFNIALGGAYTSVLLDREYPGGAYTIESTAADTTFDVYAFSAGGSLVAYTGTPGMNASGGFIKLVILGGITGDLLSFSYKNTFTSSTDNDEVTAGPYIVSANSTSLPSVDSSITITGGNFASNITATFTGTGYSETSAKSVTRNSVTSVTVVRPDSLPISGSPYTLKLSNPGVSNPTGSNAHLLTVNAGSVPTWVTGTTIANAYSKNVAYTTTVVATDPDGGTISYSSVGAMPTGLSVASTSGVISGTSTASTPLTFTIRATDSGGNSTDRTFTLPNAGPVWTSSGTLTTSQVTVAYSLQLVATDDSGVAPTYTLSSGSLPPGITLSSGGLLSGTPTTPGTYTFSVNATDANSTSTNSGNFTLVTDPAPLRALIVSGGGGGGNGQPNNVAGTGGGAGGYREVIITYQPATTYNVSVGGGGAQATGTSGGTAQRGSNGGSSFIGTAAGNISSTGGGGGGEWCGSGISGGSGGGGSGCGQPGGSGNAGGYSPSEGSTGGAGGNQQNGGSGGGAVAAGGQGGGYASGANPTYFTGATYSTGGPGATNGTSYSPSGNRGSGGAGQWYGGGASGGSAGVGGAVGLYVPNGYASVTTTGSPTISAVTGGTTYLWTGAGTWRIG